MRETSTVMDDGWKQVWAEMTDTELEDHLFTYLWLAIRTPNAHAPRGGCTSSIGSAFVVG